MPLFPQDSQGWDRLSRDCKDFRGTYGVLFFFIIPLAFLGALYLLPLLIGGA